MVEKTPAQAFILKHPASMPAGELVKLGKRAKVPFSTQHVYNTRANPKFAGEGLPGSPPAKAKANGKSHASTNQNGFSSIAKVNGKPIGEATRLDLSGDLGRPVDSVVRSIAPRRRLEAILAALDLLVEEKVMTSTAADLYWTNLRKLKP
jgi:hypothetical protein